MKLVALFGLAGLLIIASGCKDDAPGYCTEDYFQDAYMSDVQGTTTTTFGSGSTINLNQLFVNTSGDSLVFNYTEPLVSYDVYDDAGNLWGTNAVAFPETHSAYMGANDTINSYYPYSQLHGNLPPGNYQLKVGVEYQYFGGCDNGLISKEQVIDFVVQ